MSPKAVRQKIRFVNTPDGVRLAWATAGDGPTLIKAGNWLTHLEYDWDNQVWSHWMQFFSAHFDFVRYDQRGCGMSDREVVEMNVERLNQDLETVIEEIKPPQPFILFGNLQGTGAAIAYAARFPERVSHLVLYGGYVKGWAKRDDKEDVRRAEAQAELVELGWGKPSPVYRRLFTSPFLPEGTEEQIEWFDECCARTATPKMAARFMRTCGDVDVEPLLKKIRVPTLVIHARNDAVVPFNEGRRLATEIPGAQFVELDSCNHILLEDEPAWARFKEAVLDFVGVPDTSKEAKVFQSLSEREREILGKLVDGQTNVEIGKALFISEKTVRNHITKIYEKLGVNSRAQAIVLARDCGFN